jgi:hypothetical protein
MAEAKLYDAAEYLDSPEMIATYLTSGLETEDPALIAKAIGNVACAQCLTGAAIDRRLAGASRCWKRRSHVVASHLLTGEEPALWRQLRHPTPCSIRPDLLQQEQ